MALAEADVRHLHVLRLGLGDTVGVRDGRGAVATGTLVRVGRNHALIEVNDVRAVPRAPEVHLLAPVADRDRMLWLAEKATELGVASWRPVLWHRSRSVAPRGDGPTFRAKLRARMVAALLQSRGAWLPEIHPEAPPERAVAAAPAGTRIALDAGGAPIAALGLAAPVVLAVGPEGGMEQGEIELVERGGFTRAALGDSILRFETAAVGAVAVARAMLAIKTGG